MAEQKTIGQIAYEAASKSDHDPIPWDDPLNKDLGFHVDWEAAASAVWDQAVEACAQKADYWGNGGFVVQEEPGCSRYSLRDLQTYTNVTGRGIAEDIRALKRTESDNGGCQADAGAKGETVSAPMEPLHSDIIAEAVRKVSWKPEVFNVRCDENGQIFVSADGQPIMDFPPRVALELGEALVTLAANSQSSTEERSDTERPANAESSLTPQIPSPPQEKENA